MFVSLGKPDLGLVERAIGKTMFPVVTLTADADNITFESNNTVMHVISKTEGVVVNVGKGTVDGKLLTDILKKLKGTITLEANEKQLTILSKGSEFVLGLLPNDLPSFPDIKEPDYVVDADKLNEAVRKTIYATDTRETRAFCQGVYFNGHLVATDINRLAIAELGVECGLLSAASLQSLSRLKGEVKIYDLETCAVFETTEHKVSIRKLDGEFPNYKTLIPEDAPVIVNANRQKLLEVMEKAILISDKAVKITVDEAMTVEANEKVQVFSETLAVDCTGKCEVHLDPRFVIDFLKSVDDEDVKLGLNGDMRQCLFEAEGCKYILMPVRVPRR